MKLPKTFEIYLFYKAVYLSWAWLNKYAWQESYIVRHSLVYSSKKCFAFPEEVHCYEEVSLEKFSKGVKVKKKFK